MEAEAAAFEIGPGFLPDPDSPFCSECLATALELLEVLKAEADALRRFSGAELLTLVPRKEYLVNELKWKLEAARESGRDAFSDSEPFKALIKEITALNTSNGLFIKKSLSYWQALLSVFAPPGYDQTGRFERRLPCSPKGMAFRRKI